MGREHTNRDYEQELRKLREQILLMGAKVEESITGSIRALTERDTNSQSACVTPSGLSM